MQPIAIMAGMTAMAISFWVAQPESAQPVEPQKLTLQQVIDQLDTQDRIEIGRLGVALEDVSFEQAGRMVEAVVCKPLAPDAGHRSPAVLLIPGYSRSARDNIPLMIALARHGYIGMSIAQPGFGRSDGPADFAGPSSVAAADAAFELLRNDPRTDPDHIALFGYSRGAMVASILATKRDDLACVVLCAGVYDLKAGYEQATSPVLREHIEKETGGASDGALRERSSLHRAGDIKCDVLVIHGDKDINAPVTQAHALVDRLAQAGVAHEVKNLKDRDHALTRAEIETVVLPFFEAHMRD